MKKIVHVAIITCVLLAAIAIGGGFYLIDFALKPDHRGKDISGSVEHILNTHPFLQHWQDSLLQADAIRDTFIINPAGVRLHAYYIAAAQPAAKTAVIVHGYLDNAIRMMHIGYMYNRDLCCNILIPDLQFHGLSEGNSIQMGWKDRLDVMLWMETANRIFGGDTRMVVHGISMGAAATMMLSGEPHPQYVRCFVEDCGYTTVWDQFSLELSEQFHLPDFPLLYIADWLCKQRYGWGFKEASSLQQVAKCLLPMLFIHGDADTYVPTRMVYPLYEVKPDPKELWIVPGSKHADSYNKNKEAYTARVKTFVEAYLK